MAILDVFKGKDDKEIEEKDLKKDAVKSKATSDVKKDTEKSEDKVSKAQKVVSSAQYDDLILRPHITEKASLVAEGNAYTFEVAKNANKTEVAKAIKSIYKVEPVKVRIINTPRKQVFSRGKKGFKKGMKKAIVFLKKGETIEFV